MSDEETRDTAEPAQEDESKVTPEETSGKATPENNSEEGSNTGESEQNSKLRPQMLCELHSVRKEMVQNSSLAHVTEVKPYTPDTSNDLNPYYNKFIVDYMINDQGAEIPRPGFGQRPTSLGLVEPEVSWRMDHFPGPLHDSILPRCFYKPKTWSKNVSGSDSEGGSTRLPPIPKVAIPKNKQPQYQHFNMNYAHVQPFRADLRSVRGNMAQKRAQFDYDRTVKDWQRMNLKELKQLPPQSRYNVRQAVMTYLGTSKGSNKAVNEVIADLNAPEAAFAD